MNDLPLLPSERKQYHDKIKQLIKERNMAYASGLRKVTSIINQADWMSVEIKQKLLEMIWEKE